MKIYASLPGGSLVVDGVKVILAEPPELEARYREAYGRRYVTRGEPGVVDNVIVEGSMEIATRGDRQARAAIESLGGSVLD